MIYISEVIPSFIQTISIAPLQVRYYSEEIPTQHGYCAGVSRRSATHNRELRTCPRSLRGGKSGIRTHDPPVERLRLYQCATTFKNSHKRLQKRLSFRSIKMSQRKDF